MQGPSLEISQEDLATLERLQQDFQAELSTVSGRVETLSSRIADLEAQEFSPTLVMGGESIFCPVRRVWGR